MVSYAGSKSVFLLNETIVSTIRTELLLQEVKPFIQTLQKIGIDKAGAHALIDSVWSVDSSKEVSSHE